jgi:hypothetical protein
MRLLGLLGVVAFTLASAAVGVRLLLLARRTRQAPELAMGLAFVLSAAIGFPALTAAAVLGETGGSPTVAHALMAGGTLSTFCGYVGLAVGCWRIYRPSARWPLAPIAAGTAVVLAASATVLVSTGDAGTATRDAAFWCGVGVGSLTFAWNALESFLLHGQLRRRLVLGLADPEVVNRILMWGVGSAAAFAMTLHGFALRIAVGPVVSDEQRVLASLLGMVAAVAIGLAFFPPAAYRRRFAAAARPPGSA